jgi:HD-GYP domain-containing protein (c-di-GMP phosphodiesterase class II)
MQLISVRLRKAEPAESDLIVPRVLVAYAAALAVVGVGLALVLVALGSSLGAPGWVIGLLVMIAMGAERQTVRISPNAELSVAVLPMLFAGVIYGPLAAMLVGALGLLPDLGRPFTRWVIWTSMRAIAGGVAGVVATFMAGTDTAGRLLLVAAAAALAEAVVDAVLGSITVALRRTGSLSGYIRSIFPVVVATAPLYAPVVVILAYAYEQISEWSILLFFPPAFAAQQLHRLYRQEREVSGALKVANDRLERANLSFATALVATLDARDRYTAGHSAAVAIYARDIAARMGISEDEQQLAYVCGLVHDIGKIGLPPGLLDKAGALTREERRQMQLHSEIGEGILAKVDDYADIAKIVRHHHERIDGDGYPDGLHNDAIPLVSRIIAVADAYNAMTSDRPYRDAMPSRVARLRLAQAIDSQFDTAVVVAFEGILAAASEEYRLGMFDLANAELGTFSTVERRPILVGLPALAS